ncbi:MAG: 1-deoxy-D-xylulose-5-phosphate reductoisomerase [Alphaproteobacteria bacterium]|nr:1-deoxy-D-xylulose-5-phosphate reductoisomerase [Alphaproteobacteria bacterium]MBT4016424.1 1-deoxy-D-xylulose-5-phosphate reductoisomerase [Alphaproteobacteria bacterium]MBT4965974.1 1-deoxy-D-xylulose-5-phosphate reductoisomerase [Alphaproteobacteria bacterium]MBT5160423.1 1-deoxy-D-xylulose-5-phosphate reductoisomerase [Alphaproteobacteria bacterium]MBT6385209.1 1-deoxy-D-xylulose-5-phosphate reductoisomerase [Alphaproteobacteria bacterium]
MESEPRRLSILGSTGSVGCSTLDLISRTPDAFEIDVLTAHRNVALLASQAIQVGASLAVIADESCLDELRQALEGSGIEAAAGANALLEAAARPVDWMMSAIVGAAGLAPTMSAVREGAVVALANKECLVCAGDLMIEAVARHGGALLPVDSEHNAIFQVFEQDRREAIERIVLTASGGPFREMSLKDMGQVTPAQAVAHPNWDMGAKISVDSATMMNKGLELIEAHYLFDMSGDDIEILVHPQSIIHSMVGYTDGSVLAQLGSPDMRTPIAYTLGWPRRMAAPVERLDLAKIAQLTFEAPDDVRFPALSLARQALAAGGQAPNVLNAANEIAVAGFLAGQTGFLDIAGIVEDTLAAVPGSSPQSLEDVMAVDSHARRIANENLLKRQNSGDLKV